MTLRFNKSSVLLLSVILLFLGSVFNFANAQDVIRVQGKITDITTGEPIAAVNVIEDGYVVSYSDIDGNYSVRFPATQSSSSIPDSTKK